MARKYGAKVAAGASALAFTGMALAQEAANNDDLIKEVGLKMVATATVVVGIMVAFWGVKKGGQKMGWW